MARGLSDLQKSILRMAYQNRLSENRTDESAGADLYTIEIKYHVYKFPANIRNEAELRKHQGDHRFTIKGENAQISDSEYQAASVAISRAFKRLETRGLVAIYSGYYSHWTGIRLTPAGIETASLLVKSWDNLPMS